MQHSVTRGVGIESDILNILVEYQSIVKFILPDDANLFHPMSCCYSEVQSLRRREYNFLSEEILMNCKHIVLGDKSILSEFDLRLFWGQRDSFGGESVHWGQQCCSVMWREK